MDSLNGNSLFDVFINSGAILALAGVGLVLSVLILIGKPFDLNLLISVFFLVFSSYHINRKAELDQDIISHPKRTKFIINNVVLDFFAVILYIIVLFVMFIRNIESFILILIPPIIVFLYSVKLFKFNIFGFQITRLKDIPLFKNLVVALTWVVLVILPFTFYKIPINKIGIAMSIFLFIRFFINTTTFDIRDVIADRLHNVYTLPVLIGRKKTKDFLVLMNIFSILLLWQFILSMWLPLYAVGLTLIGFYGHYFLKETMKKNMDLAFLTDVVVDAEMLFWPILIIFTMFFLEFILI